LLIVFPKPSGKTDDPEPSRLTGYPTWHGKIDGNDQQKVDSFATFDSIVLLVGAILTFRWSFVEKLPKNNDYKIIHSKTIPFRFISLYCLATFVAVVASIAFDVGKLWGVFGALHNLMEVAILLLIGQNGKIKGVSFSLLWGAYYLIINTVCLFTNFPIDAVFFKVQGLAVDFALVIEFTRVFINTKKNLNEQAELQLPLNTDENRDGDNDAFAVRHPRQWLLMISAAVVHLLGNIFNTMAPNDGKTNLVFQLSYAITFLLYLLYVYFDTHTISVHGPKRFYLPETPGAKTAVLAI
ncbi:956_t:CDS:2, partial [Paraglomus brasilianum]